MNSSIISVGTELLMGQITDTNQAELSRTLNAYGIDVLYRYTVGDNPGRLEETVRDALSKTDLVISTGGLGPTEDDLTKEVFAKVMGRELVQDERALGEMNEQAMEIGVTVTENTYRQSLVPEGAEIFYNGAGVAPGFAVTEGGKTIVCLPGPPRELKSVLENGAGSFLKSFGSGALYYRVVGLFGKGEPAVETDLKDLIDGQTDPTIATYAKEGECTVRVASKRDTEQEAKDAVDAVVEEIVRREKGYVFTDTGETLPQTVGKMLLKDKITISCCESCTGGLFAGTLTSIPGISEVFDRGLVTYTYHAKMDELGVSEETLARETAVSSAVCDEMVSGLSKKTGSDLCLSVTGLAGPGGGTKEKPVGLVYIGGIYRDRKEIVELRIADLGREWIRKYAVLAMFDLARELILGEPVSPM